MDGTEVVVFCFAELKEAREGALGSVCSVILQDGGGEEHLLFAEGGRVVDEEVDYNVAGGGFEEDAHDCEVGRSPACGGN